MATLSRYIADRRSRARESREDNREIGIFRETENSLITVYQIVQ